MKKISDILSVPRQAGREFLSGAIREMTREYFDTGKISEKTKDQIFEKAYAEGRVVEAAFYEQYRDIKDHLKKQDITLSEQDKKGFADFDSFRKQAFGTLRIVNQGGLSVDTAYQELMEMAPELFPEDITHPADQLLHMFEVGKSIERVERSLDAAYGNEAEEFKKWARNDFDAALEEAAGRLHNVKRYADEKSQKQKEVKNITGEGLEEAYRQQKAARRVYEKVAAKSLLTEHDEIQIGRLLRARLSRSTWTPKRTM